ncbi:MAG: PhzF family phenazine biosynthesis protein [Rhodocyclaceae bacterium]
MRALPCFLYDAFAEHRFGGNVAGVVLLDAPVPDDAELQALAAELAAPTTGFVERLGADRYRVRFFSPSAEMAMCGHVTIGVACALLDEGLIAGDRFTQETAAGPVALTLTDRHPHPRVDMAQRLPEFDARALPTAELAAALGVDASAFDPAIRPGRASTGLRHLFVALRQEHDLAAMQRDDAALFALCHTHGIDTIGVFALTDRRPGLCRVQLRDLCHGVGNPEESASGTTNGALASFLFHRGVLTAADGTATLQATQGRDMGRPANITTRLGIVSGAISHVAVGGSAVRTLAGTLYL